MRLDLPMLQTVKTPVAFTKTQCLGRLGSLVVKLGNTQTEVLAAQRVRHAVFCNEFSVKSVDGVHERDAHDAHCDHLVVIDEATGEVVATQRFFLKQVGGVNAAIAFRSQDEFDVEDLAIRHGDKRFMELGRSCILPKWRAKRTLELLWQGTWAYALFNQVDAMVGCASFPKGDDERVCGAMAFLGRHATACEQWQVKALATGARPLFQSGQVPITDGRAARFLPPLIKGYWKLGARFASHFVPDLEFGTLDVFVVLPVSDIEPRFIRFYGEDASRLKA